MYEISNMQMTDGKHAMFAVDGRWRVQEQFGADNKWSLIDSWYDEVVVSGNTYEEAFEAIAEYKKAYEEKKADERKAATDVFERVVAVIGAETFATCNAFKDIDGKYRISVNREYFDTFGEKKARIRLALSKVSKINGKREPIAYEFVDESCSDRAIMNRYNKLMKEIEEEER